MKLFKTNYFTRVEKKFLKSHKTLFNDYISTLSKLELNPFDESLKTHRLKGDLSEFYACRINYSFRLVITIKMSEESITLINIGNHDEVYKCH